MEKNIRDIRDIRVFDLAKMAVCFEKKFPFDPEGNFKDVKIEAKNGDVGLGNGHGSKRSLFVTEDFAEEDGELQRTIIKKLFDTDIFSLSGLEELELTFRDFHKSSETGMVMIGLMSPAGYEHDVDHVNDDDFYILNKNDLMIQARRVQLKNISQP